MTLGQKIQTQRKEIGLSQEELAEQLGVSRQAVSRWENDNGYPEMEKMIRLSQIYHVSLDYLAGNEQDPFHKNATDKGWYVSMELANSFLAYQKQKYIKIGICFLLLCMSSVFSYTGIYHKISYAISTFIIIAAILLIISMVVSDNPYRKIWTEPLTFDEKVLKQLRIDFAEIKKTYKAMLLGGIFALLTGFLFLPDLYWIVPEDFRHVWYAAGDAVQGVGGYFAIYAWGILRAYKVLTINEEYWRKKKK